MASHVVGVDVSVLGQSCGRHSLPWQVHLPCMRAWHLMVTNAACASTPGPDAPAQLSRWHHLSHPRTHASQPKAADISQHKHRVMTQSCRAESAVSRVAALLLSEESTELSLPVLRSVKLDLPAVHLEA